MKNKLKELEVDSIGGNEKMTKEEEVLISEFIKSGKSLNANNPKPSLQRKKIATKAGVDKH
jgi:hypothetical protein